MKLISLILYALYSFSLFAVITEHAGTISFGPDGGDYLMEVRYGATEQSEVYSKPSFIRYEWNGRNVVKFTASKNIGIDSRTGELVIYTHTGWDDYKYVYKVQQSAYPISVTSSTNLFVKTGGLGKITVNANDVVSWPAATENKWIRLSQTSGLGTQTFSFDVLENMLEKKRSGSVLVAGKTLSITQDGQLEYKGSASSVTSGVKIKYGVYGKGVEEFLVDDKLVFSSEGQGEFTWQPQKLGSHKLVYTANGKAWTNTLNIAELDYWTQPAPNPPMAKDSKISITPTTRDFAVGGGGAAIITSGSGTWTAAVSDSWITLNATSGSVGYPVAYTVSANTNVETRVGYVYVSGYTHTVTQEGRGADVNKTNITVEHQGGNGAINIVAEDRMVWQARPNVDWISVSPTSGAGAGSVKYQVAPFNEVLTRQGTMTIAGNTVTVFQYGRRMALDSYSIAKDWHAHVIPITVDALAITEWKVMPNASWISVVDAGNGKGGDLVSIAISENPSYKARTGTVTIGTETFTITQEGRTDLAFSVSPAQSTASVEGAYGLIAVTATPDLPWTAKSGVNWVTIQSATASGAGNGNVVYSASPNSTLYDRTGMITVTPEKASGVAAKTHTVKQPAAVSVLSLSGYEFEAAGESCAVEVSVADIVEWKVEESLDWLTVNGSTSRTGPGTVTLQAAANDTVYPRSGKVTIARKTFTVSQKARGVAVEYDVKLFGTDGGYESISIHPDGKVSWTAVASDPTWITIFQGNSGTGDGEILYIISPYVGDGGMRTGTITVGDKVVYITQRAYDLSISPNGKKVSGNNGEGEFGVSASIGDVWNAIVTEPWITIVDGYDAGTGNGTVRFIYTENTTGKTRTGKIIVAGEVYTLEQAARTMVSITATAERGGKVSGGGLYDLGSSVTLTAVPDDGYKFSYWTGDVDSMQNPITVTADVAKSLTAVFEPLPIAFDSVTSGTDGVRLSWNNLAWATEYRIYRGVTSVPSSATVLAEIVNTGNCAYLDESGVVGMTYWYWIEAEGAEDSVMSDPMTGMKQKPIVISPIIYGNLRGATHTNPETYQEGTGTLVSFTNPSGVTGYTFAGWIPPQITADMTGAQTVTANWTANSYSISYNPNGGSGTMEPTFATYDTEVAVSANGYERSGYTFKGWATEPDGNVVYGAGQSVTNLTAQFGGVVALYAVWEAEKVENPVITPGDGSVFKGDSCTVTITCATPDAIIYYSTNGRTPSENDRFRYEEPFTISDTTTVTAFAVRNGVKSGYVDATITHVKQAVLTIESALDVSGVVSVETGGEVEWLPVDDLSSKVGGSFAASGEVVDDDEVEHTSWLKIKVNGKGTLSFWWRVDCEPDPRGRFTYDRGSVTVDGDQVDCKDGKTDWMYYSVTFDTADEHEIVWTYMSDGWLPVDDGYGNRMCVDGVAWNPVVIAEPIPELSDSATAAEVASALAGSADEKLIENITSAAEYAAYREWALSVKGADGAVTVKASPNAWLSYALSCNSLIDAAPRNGDVVIDGIDSAATDGTFGFTVRVKDVAVGGNALEANIRKIFGVEGIEDLNVGTFSSEAVEVKATQVIDGSVRFTVLPKRSGMKNERPSKFFFRVKMFTGSDDDFEPSLPSEPTPIVFTVVFDANGGTGGTERTVQEGLPVGGFPEVSRNGYTFDDWWTSAEGGARVFDSTIVTANTTFYAHWQINTYTVVLDANDGTAGTVTSRTHGETLGVLPTPVREGYIFAGWWTAVFGGTQVYAEMVVVEDMTVYARWVEKDFKDKVQLWEGGPYWATTNIGAEKPEDSGYYFWWGDTVGYKRENDKWVASDGSNFLFSSGNTPTYNKSISTLKSEGWITADGVLAPAHDAANVHWGNGWRIPKEAECRALIDNCDWTWTTINGVAGYIVCGRGVYASNSIFLPAVGVGDGVSINEFGTRGGYGSSAPYSTILAWHIGFASDGHFCYGTYMRYGLSIRPVSE